LRPRHVEPPRPFDQCPVHAWALARAIEKRTQEHFRKSVLGIPLNIVGSSFFGSEDSEPSIGLA
jgi:hypothetical protein